MVTSPQMIDSPPAEKPLVLSYGRPVQYRRIKVWLCIVLLAGVAIHIFSLWWGEAVYQQTALLYWQWKCLNYTASPLQSVSYSMNSTDPHKSREGDVPEVWRQFNDFAGYFLSPSAKRPSGLPDAVAFLHKCISPSGTSYLVCVTCYNHDDYENGGRIVGPGLYVGGDYLTGLAIKPGGIGQQPVKVPRQDRLSAFSNNPPTSTIFAGQIDPNDPSHFTIRYEVEGHPDVIDGYVDRQGAVKLTPRNPPGRVYSVK